jgi:hypothetical protein
LRESYGVEIDADEDTGLMVALTGRDRRADDAVALCAPAGPADLELGSVVRLLESGGRERR